MKEIEVSYGSRTVDDNGNIVRYNSGPTDQGYVYKDVDAWKSGNGICYISEYGMEEYENELERVPKDEIVDYHKDNASIGYTRQDFIDMCDGDEALAESVFYEVDWQYPETLLAEYDY